MIAQRVPYFPVLSQLDRGTPIGDRVGGVGGQVKISLSYVNAACAPSKWCSPYPTLSRRQKGCSVDEIVIAVADHEC